MNLSELTDKIYAEGVEKGNAQAQEIIAQAQAKADAIVAEARKAGKQLSLSEETRPIVGGLILSQGRIEVNCALDTLAAQRRSELSGEAARLLFS